MSVSLMAMAFRTDLPSTRKLVLLALCDSANDQGECYPSISALVGKCSLSERAIQGSIAELEREGYLSRELRPGRATTYWITPAANAPRTKCTPAPDAPAPAAGAPPPPQDVHPTPAPRAPRTIIEPSVEPSKKRDSGSAPAPIPPAFLGDSNFEEIPKRAVVLLAPEWELPEAWGIDAEALGWKSGEILRESEKFRQYFVAGKGAGTRRGVKGWRQSWSNWLANAERYAKR